MQLKQIIIKVYFALTGKTFQRRKSNWQHNFNYIKTIKLPYHYV